MKEELFSISKAGLQDVTFLQEMLFEAAYWRPDRPRPSMAEGLSRPDLVYLLDGWGRQGDLAGLAVSQARERLGAAWIRRWTAARHSYGFLDESTPELGIGVRREARGRGVGMALVTTLLAEAYSQGVDQVSLSVEKENPALRLYSRPGFVVSCDTGGAYTMVAPAGLRRGRARVCT